MTVALEFSSVFFDCTYNFPAPFACIILWMCSFVFVYEWAGVEMEWDEKWNEMRWDEGKCSTVHVATVLCYDTNGKNLIIKIQNVLEIILGRLRNIHLSCHMPCYRIKILANVKCEDQKWNVKQSPENLQAFPNKQLTYIYRTPNIHIKYKI